MGADRDKRLGADRGAQPGAIGGIPAGADGNGRVARSRDRGELAKTTGREDAGSGAHRRIAHCECGATLEGASEQELYEVAQLHVAQHHPQLLGAIGPEVVRQMAEDAGTTVSGSGQ